MPLIEIKLKLDTRHKFFGIKFECRVPVIFVIGFNENGLNIQAVHITMIILQGFLYKS